MQIEIRQVMKSSHLFGGLRADLIDEIASSATRKTIAPGEILFQKGDPADALWGVLSGRIVIEVVTDDGKEMVLDAFGEGEVFGEVGVIDFGPRRVEARAIEGGELFRLERKHFLKHLQSSPELCFRVFSLLCSHLRQTTENLEDTALYKLPNRLAKRLTMLAADSPASHGAILHIGQSDLASMLGVNREAVNRHLRVFERDGLIALRRQRIEIVDRQALADLASPGQNGDKGGWGIENLDALEYSAFTFSQQRENSQAPTQRHATGLMAIDAAEYSRSLMTDAAGTLSRIETGLKAVDQSIELYQGHTVWHAGDRVLAEFPDAQLAMQAALHIQEQVSPARHAGGSKRDSLFRIGVHFDDALTNDHRFSGEAVNTAIHLTRLSGAGGIAISGAVRDSLDNREQLELQFLGDHELKNVPGKVPVYSVQVIPMFKLLALRLQTLIPRRYRLALSLVTVLLAVAIIWQAGEQFGINRSPAPGPLTRSIAVLPFTPEGDFSNAYLANGLTEEIRTALAPMPEMLVIGATSSAYFEEWDATVQEIGEVLQVAYVLKGSIGLTGDQLMVSSRLVETKNGLEIWHHNYQGTWRELNSFKADIVRLAGETLSGGDQGSQTGAVVSPITENQEAYLLYLQARELINEYTRASLVEALTKLEDALELDPEFASAHVAIAETYGKLTWFSDYYKVNFQQESDALARPHIERALAIDANFAEAYVALGKISPDENAEPVYRKAISLNPNLAEAQLWLGIELGNQLHSWNECLPYLEKALEIEPLWIEAAEVLVEFLTYIPARRKEALAIIAYLKTQRPDHPRVTTLEAHWLLLEGRSSEAVALLEKTLVFDPGSTWAQYLLNSAWFSLGETERALESADWQRQWRFVLSPDREESLRQMREIDEDPAISSVINPGLSAYIYVMLREWQSAIEVLAEYSQDPEGLRGQVAKRYSPALSLAVAYKALGDDERYLRFAGIEKAALDIRSEDGSIRNFEYSRIMARLYALEGRPFDAMLELERQITTGPNDPRELIYPAFDEIRNYPEFRKLQDLQRQRVNLERKKLGLASIPGKDSPSQD